MANDEGEMTEADRMECVADLHTMVDEFARSPDQQVVLVVIDQLDEETDSTDLRAWIRNDGIIRAIGHISRKMECCNNPECAYTAFKAEVTAAFAKFVAEVGGSPEPLNTKPH